MIFYIFDCSSPFCFFVTPKSRLTLLIYPACSSRLANLRQSKLRTMGINHHESWEIKSQFVIPEYFHLHAIFNLRRQFLYADKISIPAGKMYGIYYNEAWKMNTIVPVVCQRVRSVTIYEQENLCYFFTHRSEFLTCKNKFLPRPEFLSRECFYPANVFIPR